MSVRDATSQAIEILASAFRKQVLVADGGVDLNGSTAIVNSLLPVVPCLSQQSKRVPRAGLHVFLP
jgi:hypothetical protein